MEEDCHESTWSQLEVTYSMRLNSEDHAETRLVSDLLCGMFLIDQVPPSLRTENHSALWALTSRELDLQPSLKDLD